MGRKWWGGCAIFGGAGSPSNTEPRPTFVSSSILVYRAIWRQRDGLQIGGCAPFFFGGGEAESPSDTMSPTCLPSFIVIHPTVWPQYANVTDIQLYIQTDRQRGQDRHTG